MTTVDKKEIGYRQWTLPAPRAIFLLVHGLGTHSGRWEALAGFFLEKGISSYAIELRDFDRPDDPGRGSDSFVSCYSKILRLYDIAAKDNPAKKIFLVGESLGAVMSLLLAARQGGLFGGLICISPAFVNRYRLKMLDCIKMFTPLLYDPHKQFILPFDSSMYTRDASQRDKLDHDGREYHSVSSKFILEILLAQSRARKLHKDMATPILFLVAGEDNIVDPSATKKVFNGLKAKDKTLVEFPGMYHALSIELGRESVFEELLKWTEKRIKFGPIGERHEQLM